MRSPMLLNMRTSCALILPRFFKKFFNASSLSFPCDNSCALCELQTASIMTTFCAQFAVNAELFLVSIMQQLLWQQRSREFVNESAASAVSLD